MPGDLTQSESDAAPSRFSSQSDDDRSREFSHTFGIGSRDGAAIVEYKVSVEFSLRFRDKVEVDTRGGLDVALGEHLGLSFGDDGYCFSMKTAPIKEPVFGSLRMCPDGTYALGIGLDAVGVAGIELGLGSEGQSISGYVGPVGAKATGDMALGAGALNVYRDLQRFVEQALIRGYSGTAF